MKNSKKIVQRKYMSTYDFVNTNSLEEEATKLFGEKWEAEDDVVQIEQLLELLNKDYWTVVVIDDGSRSDYDLMVSFNSDLARIGQLEEELKLKNTPKKAKKYSYIPLHSAGWMLVLCNNKIVNYYADHGSPDNTWDYTDKVFCAMLKAYGEQLPIEEIIGLKNSVDAQLWDCPRKLNVKKTTF